LIPWLLLLASRWTRNPSLWAAIIASAVLFPLSIALVQVPLQQAIGSGIVALVGVETARNLVLVAGIPGLLVASLVQEGTKLLVAIAALKLSRSEVGPLAGLGYGAASGAGYGGFEAFWVFNQIFAAGFSWAVVQISGFGALLGFIERFFTVPLHIGATAIAGYGYGAGRTWRFFLAAVLLHTAANYGALLYQSQLANIIVVEVWVAAISLVAIGSALWLRFHRQR